VDIRARVLEPLAFLGLVLDPARNASTAKEKDIAADGSRVKAFVIPTNEELSIALKTRRVVEAAAGAAR
jgi:acetate kinase